MLGLSIASSPKGISDSNSLSNPRSVCVFRACVSMDGSQTLSHNKNGSIPELKSINGHTGIKICFSISLMNFINVDLTPRKFESFNFMALICP